jgi:excisionase family DNA binding protein
VFGMKVDNNGAETSLRLLLTVDEAADRLGLGRTKVYELLMRGDLPSVRIGTARRVPASALEAFVERLISAQAEDI